MAKLTFPIVGCFYRPPAKAILEVLASGTPLVLRPEPDNPSDPQAVMVSILGTTLAVLSPKAKEVLAQTLPLWGSELDEVLSRGEVHLGYVPRTSSAEVAAALAGHCAMGALTFAANGQPQVTVTSDLTGIDLATGEIIHGT